MGYNIKEFLESNPNLIPEGRYPVIIESAEVKKSKSNKDMLALTLSIISGPYINQKLWVNIVLEGRAFKYIIDILKTYNSSLLNSIDAQAEEIAKDMVGKKMSVFVETRITENGSFNVVSQYKPLEKNSIFK